MRILCYLLTVLTPGASGHRRPRAGRSSSTTPPATTASPDSRRAGRWRPGWAGAYLGQGTTAGRAGRRRSCWPRPTPPIARASAWWAAGTAARRSSRSRSGATAPSSTVPRRCRRSMGIVQGRDFPSPPAAMGYQQLFLDGRPAVRVIAAQAAKSPPELEASPVVLLDGRIYFCVDKTKLPGDYKLSYARQQTGITLVPRRSRAHRRSHGAGFSGGRHQPV